MHPQLCKLVSDLSYKGLLRPHESAAARRIKIRTPPRSSSSAAPSPPPPPPPPLLSKPSGVVFVPVEHEGNSQASAEEVSAVRAVCEQLLHDGSLVDDDAAK